MLDEFNNYYHFEQLVRNILESNHFVISDSYDDVDQDTNEESNAFNFDFKAKLNNKIWAVDIKHYRTERAQSQLIETAASQLSRNLVLENKINGMLIVSCALNPERRLNIENKFGITIFDRVDLFNYSANSPELTEELSVFLEESSDISKYTNSRNLDQIIENPVAPMPLSTTDTTGTDLRTRLLELKKGKASWSQYEKLCEEILKYLFKNNLHGWHKQYRTDDHLNRYDYICRIRPGTEFWSFLLDHLNSRYIVFEFKNYSDKISQGQVLTTEKYLLEKALRRVAIIFCRTGAEKSAEIMTQGAMREHGKLILILDDDIVGKLLMMKEEGSDPSDLLFDMADSFLLKLPR